MDPNAVVPGTGQTVQDLLNLGYSQADIQSMMGPSGVATMDTGSGDSGGGVSMSGLGTLFAGIGTGFANAYRAFTGQPSQGAVINPRTGQPYTQQQLQALASQTSLGTGNLALGNLLPWILIGAVAYLVLRK